MFETNLHNYSSNEFFNRNPERINILKEFESLDYELRYFREFDNHHNYNCIILFESKYGLNKNIPFTLDLHGFKRESANNALKKYLQLCLKHSIPIIRIIYGRGTVLSQLVIESIQSYNLIDYEINFGHVDIYLKNGNYKLWSVINPKLKNVEDECFKWECEICHRYLTVPKINGSKVKSVCPVCEAEYFIQDDLVEIKKDIVKCSNCETFLKIPYTSYRLKTLCKSCSKTTYYKYGKEIPSERKIIDRTNSSYNAYSSYNTNNTQMYSNAYQPKNEGCFIATFVYQNENAIEMQTLRAFRDKKLLTNNFGRLFCKIYYYLSPFLISKFRYSKIFYYIVFYFLNVIINLLRKYWLKNS